MIERQHRTLQSIFFTKIIVIVVTTMATERQQPPHVSDILVPRVQSVAGMQGLCRLIKASIFEGLFGINTGSDDRMHRRHLGSAYAVPSVLYSKRLESLSSELLGIGGRMYDILSVGDDDAGNRFTGVVYSRQKKPAGITITVLSPRTLDDEDRKLLHDAFQSAGFDRYDVREYDFVCDAFGYKFSMNSAGLLSLLYCIIDIVNLDNVGRWGEKRAVLDAQYLQKDGGGDAYDSPGFPFVRMLGMLRVLYYIATNPVHRLDPIHTTELFEQYFVPLGWYVGDGKAANGWELMLNHLYGVGTSGSKRGASSTTGSTTKGKTVKKTVKKRVKK